MRTHPDSLLTAEKFWDLAIEKETKAQEAKRVKQARADGVPQYCEAVADWEKVDTKCKTECTAAVAHNKKAWTMRRPQLCCACKSVILRFLHSTPTSGLIDN
jgi:hypothetical protein